MTVVASIPVVPAARIPNAYGSTARFMLWLDLACCCLVGLNALVAAGVLLGYIHADYSPERATVEMITGGGIALCGIGGNLLLLRKRHAGLLLAWTTLLFVAAGIVASYALLPQLLADPEALPCPPEIAVAGVVIGTVVRACYNFLYVLTLAHVRRVVQREPG